MKIDTILENLRVEIAHYIWGTDLDDLEWGKGEAEIIIQKVLSTLGITIKYNVHPKVTIAGSQILVDPPEEQKMNLKERIEELRRYYKSLPTPALVEEFGEDIFTDVLSILEKIPPPPIRVG